MPGDLLVLYRLYRVINSINLFATVIDNILSTEYSNRRRNIKRGKPWWYATYWFNPSKIRPTSSIDVERCISKYKYNILSDCRRRFSFENLNKTVDSPMHIRYIGKSFCNYYFTYLYVLDFKRNQQYWRIDCAWRKTEGSVNRNLCYY